jgi:SAM-dependent methyltransferase
MPRLYHELADWFHLLTAPSEYVEEAAIYRGHLDDATRVERVLELGCGGGNNAFHLKRRYEMTLTDASEAMVGVSRSINPECEHFVADMRTLRSDREFDAVFIHDAIDYLTTFDDLRAALQTAYWHLRPGGVALLCPDHVRESFAPGTSHGGHDDGTRGLRYLEWTWDPDPSDLTYTIDFAYLLREGMGVRVEHDRHLCGLFARHEWLRTLRETGFERIDVLAGPEGTEVFRARR